MDFSELTDTAFSDLMQEAIALASSRSGNTYYPVSTLRTLPQQYAIYAVGRENPDLLEKLFDVTSAFESQLTMDQSIIKTRPGSEVWTYARTPYTAMHTLGCAVDINVKKGSKVLPESASSYPALVLSFYELAKKRNMNVKWGGDFSGDFKDYPHFQRCINPALYIRNAGLDFSAVPTYDAMLNTIRSELNDELGYPIIKTRTINRNFVYYYVIRDEGVVESCRASRWSNAAYYDLQRRYYGKIIVH